MQLHIMPSVNVVLCLILLLGGPAEGQRKKNLLHQDFRALLSPTSLGLVVLGLGAAGMAHPWDDEIEGRVGEHALLRGVLDLGDIYGSSTYCGSTALGTWVLARWTHRPALQAVSSEVLRALVLSNALVIPLKLGVGRARPDGSNKLSFPSGHAATAFAMTTVLSRRYGWCLGVPLYAFTAMVPVSRIHHRRHFFSDVVGGAVLGLVAGHAVTRQEEGEKVGWAWMPVYTASGWLLQTRWTL